MPSQRVCLFGGTFDPIHKAHLEMARGAAAKFGLDTVIFIPAGNPPHKDTASITPYCHRFEMVKLACADYPNLSVSDIENGTERSYTFNTVQRMRQDLSLDEDVFFLIGADAFDELKTWYRWNELADLTTFIVVSRPGRKYHIPSGVKVLRLDDIQLPAASRMIRAEIAADKPTPELPAAVRAYIDAHGLYRG